MAIHYKKTSVDNLQVLKPGAHIRVIRGSSSSNSNGLYDHHMLVVFTRGHDNELRVIHYTLTDGEGQSSAVSFSGAGGEAEVVEETITLLSDDRIELLEYPNSEDCYQGEEAIERARTKKGEKAYGLFSNNCECFVNWALTGQAVSNQAQTGLIRAGLGALVGAVQGYFRQGGTVASAVSGAASGAHEGYMDFRKNRH